MSSKNPIRTKKQIKEYFKPVYELMFSLSCIIKEPESQRYFKEIYNDLYYTTKKEVPISVYELDLVTVYFKLERTRLADRIFTAFESLMEDMTGETYVLTNVRQVLKIQEIFNLPKKQFRTLLKLRNEVLIYRIDAGLRGDFLHIIFTYRSHSSIRQWMKNNIPVSLKNLSNNWKFELPLFMQDLDAKVDAIEEGELPELTEGETVVEFDDGFEWIMLPYGFCANEGSHMKHCGGYEGDDYRILSLRSDDGQKVHLTFIAEISVQNKWHLIEMKGKSNKPPSKKYKPYIIELLKHPNIYVVKGGGYLRENNFNFNDDLNSEEQLEVLYANENLAITQLPRK